jgi:hypothetical protein
MQNSQFDGKTMEVLFVLVEHHEKEQQHSQRPSYNAPRAMAVRTLPGSRGVL